VKFNVDIGTETAEGLHSLDQDHEQVDSLVSKKRKTLKDELHSPHMLLRGGGFFMLNTKEQETNKKASTSLPS
jgi:hypothetical protein